jgi:hypothetical protein
MQIAKQRLQRLKRRDFLPMERQGVIGKNAQIYNQKLSLAALLRFITTEY